MGEAWQAPGPAGCPMFPPHNPDFGPSRFWGWAPLLSRREPPARPGSPLGTGPRAFPPGSRKRIPAKTGGPVQGATPREEGCRKRHAAGTHAASIGQKAGFKGRAGCRPPEKAALGSIFAARAKKRKLGTRIAEAASCAKSSEQFFFFFFLFYLAGASGPRGAPKVPFSFFLLFLCQMGGIPRKKHPHCLWQAWEKSENRASFFFALIALFFAVSSQGLLLGRRDCGQGGGASYDFTSAGGFFPRFTDRFLGAVARAGFSEKDCCTNKWPNASTF